MDDATSPTEGRPSEVPRASEAAARPSVELEHPKEHDFDQRHDGPREAAHVQIAHGSAKDYETDGETGANGVTKSKSLPDAVNSPTSPLGPPGRRSTTFARTQDRTQERPPRRSTQMSGRTSRDFDARRNGPYGRPSLTMTRRQSSGVILPTSPIATTPGAQGEENKDEGETAPPFETLEISDIAFEPEPPPLNYTLHTRKRSIFIFWSFILIDSIAMPIGLYFGLWYGTNLTPNTVFSIVTAALGGISIFEYFLRFWRLWKHSSTCRVIGARRMYLDWFHWNFSFAWVVVMIELIVGTIPTHPPIRLLSMPLASMLYAFGTELIIVDVLRYFQVPAPFRLSSVPKGSQLRPCVYSLIEDVVAVDGSGGTEYRENLNRRYEASHVFRAMLRRLGVFWAIGAEGAAVVTTIIVFTVSKDAAYVVGWTLPFVWAGIWVLVTIWYVKRKLKEEKKAWAEEVAAKSNA